MKCVGSTSSTTRSVGVGKQHMEGFHAHVPAPLLEPRRLANRHSACRRASRRDADARRAASCSRAALRTTEWRGISAPTAPPLRRVRRKTCQRWGSLWPRRQRPGDQGHRCQGGSDGWRVFACRNPKGSREWAASVACNAERTDGLMPEIAELLLILPCAQQAAQQDELAQMIGVVVGKQKSFAKNRLSVAVRDASVKVRRGIARRAPASRPNRPGKRRRFYSTPWSWAARLLSASTLRARPARHAWHRG